MDETGQADHLPSWLREVVGDADERFRNLPPPAAHFDDKERREREASQEAARRLERFRMSIPATYRWAALGDPALARCGAIAKHLAAAEVAARRTRVVLVGPAGTGKTLLGVAMLRAWHEANDGAIPMFARSYRLATCRIQTPAGHGEADYVEEALRWGLVLVDDLGVAGSTSTDANPTVIFERFDADAPTWVTTGFNAEQLAAKYGDGIARRVFERATVIDLGKR